VSEPQNPGEQQKEIQETPTFSFSRYLIAPYERASRYIPADLTNKMDAPALSEGYLRWYHEVVVQPPVTNRLDNSPKLAARATKVKNSYGSGYTCKDEVKKAASGKVSKGRKKSRTGRKKRHSKLFVSDANLLERKRRAERKAEGEITALMRRMTLGEDGNG